MKCPICSDATLLMTERQGVEIDYCPQCRGVWLDRGELDKLLDIASCAPSAVRNPAAAMAATAPVQPAFHPDFRLHDSHHGGKHHRKKSWLSEIFD